MILARMDEVYPEPEEKERYIKNLNKGTFSSILAGGKKPRKRTRKHRKKKPPKKTRKHKRKTRKN